MGNLSSNVSLDPMRLNAVTLLGAGDDSLDMDTSGYAQANSFVDADNGDDAVRLRHRMFAIVDRTNLNIVVLLGAGSDTLALEASGYDHIWTLIDTGSAGNVIRSHYGRGVYRLFLDDE